jgi:4-amino-4-deoxy-L-arabinose transferase-like glycosyltransferase
LLVIVLLGLLLRVHQLDRQSFWIDEAFSALMADPRYARPALWQYDVHPPLYYALLSLWGLWSRSDWWLRLLSVVLGVATIPVVYGLGARLLGRAAALWAAALLSVLQIHVAYSQEARMYALMVLLFAGALWSLVVGARDGRPAGWVGYAVCAVLLLYAQALGTLYVAILAALFPVVAPRLPRGLDWRPWLLAHVAIALAFVPYALTYARRAGGVAAVFWIPPSGPEPPLLTTLFQWTVAPIPSPSQILVRHLGLDPGALLGRWLWFAPVLVVLVLAMYLVPSERAWTRSSLILAYAAPVFILSALSLTIRPLLIPRMLLPTVVPTVLLLGALAAPGPGRRAWRHTALGAVFLVLLLGSVYHLRHVAKDEWRQASRHLQENVGPTDVILYNVGPSTRFPAGAIDDQGRFLINRYDERRVLARVPQVLGPELTAGCAAEERGRCLGRYLRAHQPGQVVWLVQGYARPGPDLAGVAPLEVREVVRLRGVELERVVTKP